MVGLVEAVVGEEALVVSEAVDLEAVGQEEIGKLNPM